MNKISKYIFLGVIVGGAVCALVSVALLSAATAQSKWITYVYATTVSGVSASAVIDVGLWTVYGTIVATVFGMKTTTVVAGDTTDYNYFDASLVKLCRAFAILGILTIFASAVFAVVGYFLQKLTKSFLIVSVGLAGFSVFVITLALALLKSKLLSGMLLNTPYDLGTAGVVMAAVSLVAYTVALVLFVKGLVESTATAPNVESQATSGTKGSKPDNAELSEKP